MYLIGAGPGDPKLLTLRGLECIREAEVIVYDRLINRRLLSYARADAELIYAGKSPEGHYLTQDAINEILAERARAGKKVARLKGGDPFIFGRGGEEAEYLAGSGLDFEIVPGVTSAVAAPAYAGIPLTHRDFTATVAIVTGNEDPHKPDSNIDWGKLATGAGTLVFLMGMANLPDIVGKLVEHGRSPDTPAAVIHWGTWPEQVTVEGSLGNIVQKVKAAGVKNPSVVVVGEVCKLRPVLSWVEKRPLFGKRVLVTRAREQASALSEALGELGAEPYEFPTIAIAPPADWGPLDRAIAQAGTFDWIIFTSVNGVKYFFRRLRDLGRDIRELHGVRLAAIGPQTRGVLEGFGLRAAFVPEAFRAEEIARGLKELIKKDERILLPRTDIAPKALNDALTEAGARVTEVTAYRTLAVDENTGEVRRLLEEGRVHAVTLTSSSTAKNLVRLLGGDAPTLLSGVAVASIGPVTSATARELGLRVDVEASEHTIPGLVRELEKYFVGSRGSA
ncbi:uroporphyrinogen-III C-methyltransferase [Desulforudis sp. 1031]|uniref:uroporphyrinogen-III C-methyltransferase n=1 Tax=unclassified Candidatus Desulforudis TaxID=2635950 RepID=UPI003CE8BE53